MFFIAFSFISSQKYCYLEYTFVEQNNEWAKTSGTCLFCFAGSVDYDLVAHRTHLISAG